MNIRIRVCKRRKILQRCFHALAIILLCSGGLCRSTYGQKPVPEVPLSCVQADHSNPIRLLVIGDSIIWGQGLKETNKISYLVQDWLCRSTNRAVFVKRKAHSGAVIGPAETAVNGKPDRDVTDGEINLGDPTINEQVDIALSEYKKESVDNSLVDLVLVDGCINDVSADVIINTKTNLLELRNKTTENCQAPMEGLLQKITREFPQAWVVVTGYYPIISEKTKRNLIISLVQRFLIRNFSEALKTKEKYLKRQSISLSSEWKIASDESLKNSVETINQELEKKGRPRVIRFVKVNFSPDDSFNAPDSSLWNLKTAEFSRHNFGGRLKFILTFKFIRDLKPNDEQLDNRAKGCKKVYEDNTLRVRCKFASLGHPNKVGAQKYAAAIESELTAVLDSRGWIRTAVPFR